MTTFLATLTPMLTLFFCIAVGYTATKTGILPDSAGKTLAKLETWIFLPALSFTTMMRFCTVASLSTHITNVAMACISVTISLTIAIPLSRLFAKKGSADRGVYAYALAFANSGYLGDPIILTLFGESVLAYYKLFCLPISLTIYTWGIDAMIPRGEEKGTPFKRILNAPTLAMLFGIAVGLSGLGGYMPSFLTSALDLLKSCMGPAAMLLAGVTIARFDLRSMLQDKKVYVVSLLRAFVIPACLVAALFGIKSLANLSFGLSIGNDVLFLCLFATGSAIGLNTIIFPEAYGTNPKIGAGMTLISHVFGVFSIPVMYAIMVAIFGT